MIFRIIIIISTNGGVLSQLLKIKYFKEKIVEVISDRHCGAIDVANKAGINTKIFETTSGNEFSNKIVEYCNFKQVDLFVSFYTKLFNGNFIKAAQNKIINLHPSILPACSGLDGFGDTLKSGSKFIGTTIHFVDSGIDTGLPIIQSAIPLNQNKTKDELRHLLFVDQCRTLLQVVRWFEQKRINIENNIVKIDNVNYDTGLYSPKLDFDLAQKFNVKRHTKNAKDSKINSTELNDILDLRDTTNHPISIQYSEMYQKAVLNGIIDHGRSQPGFGLKDKSPFVLVAKRAIDFGIEKDGVIDAMIDLFTKYYKMVQPKSAAEWLGLNVDINSPLSSAPPWAAVFPWRARSIDSYRQAYENAALKENSIISKEIDISNGWLFCGPVSYEKRKIEAIRMQYVLSEIKKNGFQRWNTSEGDVNATALVNERGEWRWLITGGNHRASAAAAFGMINIPIRINLVIYRNQVKYWTHVLNGLFSEKDALSIFDNYFDAKTPPITGEWQSENL